MDRRLREASIETSGTGAWLLLLGLLLGLGSIAAQAWQQPSAPRFYSFATCDQDQNGTVTIDELLRGVHALLHQG